MDSVVVPVFGDSATLAELIRRIDGTLQPRGEPYEILLVLDGGPAEDGAAAREVRGDRTDVRVLELDRNRGQHSALLCGMAEARGQRVITLDADLQNPPEEMGRLLDRAAEGFDAVFGVPREKRHGLVRRLGSRFLQWLTGPLYGRPRDLVVSNYRVVGRRVVEGVLRRANAYPYLQGLILETGGRFTHMAVDHAPRERGRSTYGPLRMAGFVARMVVGSPRLPFRFLLGPILRRPPYRLLRRG